MANGFFAGITFVLARLYQAQAGLAGEDTG
jgi:hypothetical protein